MFDETGGVILSNCGYGIRPILTLKVLRQAGPDIGDMELRRSMLEPEVIGNFG